MTKEEAKENAIEALVEKMSEEHKNQYSTIQSQIKELSDNGEFSTYISRGIFRDVGDLLIAEGFELNSTKGGIYINWLQ